MSQYKGKPVTILRDAKQGDQGYDQAKDQVVVRTADGNETVALRTEVTN